MPTVLRWNGYRFYFFSNEGHEPPHVHVDKAGRSCKLWLAPVRVAQNHTAMGNTRSAKFVLKLLNAKPSLWTLGMGILEIKADSRVDSVDVSDARLSVRLKDGRQVSAPLDWFPRLKSASPAERANWETCAAGHGIHWPKIDEDLSVDGLLRVTSVER